MAVKMTIGRTISNKMPNRERSPRKLTIRPSISVVMAANATLVRRLIGSRIQSPVNQCATRSGHSIRNVKTRLRCTLPPGPGNELTTQVRSSSRTWDAQWIKTAGGTTCLSGSPPTM